MSEDKDLNKKAKATNQPKQTKPNWREKLRSQTKSENSPGRKAHIEAALELWSELEGDVKE